MADWTCVLELDSRRQTLAGSSADLCAAIGRGADLRIYTDFVHNEHIDPTSDNPELVQEVSDFRVTYLIEGRWAAGIMSLRQPVDIPVGFGPRPSMSFFMYNQDGQQAIARPFLDGGPITGSLGPAPHDPSFTSLPKYHQFDSWDAGTNAPSHNFVYDFGKFRYFVRDDWQEVLSHDAEGHVLSGSLNALADAFLSGAEVKVGVRGVCADLAGAAPALDHELFVQAGPGYYYSETRLFLSESQPVVRVRPAVPMRYESQAWDFGWLMPRTDGLVARLRCDPHTLHFIKDTQRYPVRWFVR